MELAKTREPITPSFVSPRETETTLRLIDAPGRDELDGHPELQPLLTDGWTVRRVAPRIVEGDGAQFLVVLERPVRTAQPFAPPDGAPRSRKVPSLARA